MKLQAHILVGLPGSGKSTWIKEQAWNWSNTTLISTDAHVEQYAIAQRKTYNEVFHEYMPIAVHRMSNDVIKAVNDGRHIVWDQTSTTIAARRKKFNMIPDTYEIIAVVLRTPAKEEWDRRLVSRPGKSIPPAVIQTMQANWEDPTEAEGFSKIVYIG